MTKSFFSPDALDIIRRDAAEWKRRALIAEGKLSGYQRLRELGEKVVSAVAGGADSDISVADAVDELGSELVVLDIVDSPRDYFNQVIELTEELRFHVRTRAGLGGSCSTLDVENGVVEIESLQPDEGKAIGLVFQVLQVADIVAAQEGEREPELSASHLHNLVPAFMSISANLGLLEPRLGITHASIEAFVSSLEAERRVEAASTAG